MVRALERIERDLAELDQSLTTLADDLQGAYQRYLVALGQAVRQQLINATHHLCTQGYPEDFLQLSFTQRQKLLQQFRQITTHLEEQLKDVLTPPLEESESEVASASDSELPDNLSMQVLSTLLEPPLSDGRRDKADKKSESGTTSEIDAATIALLAAQLSDGVVSDESGDDGEMGLTQMELSLTEEDDRLIKLAVMGTKRKDHSLPMRLLRWHKRLEHRILKLLKDASRDANHQLQEVGILPKALPEEVIIAATQAEVSQSSVSNPPNLISLLVETGLVDQDESPSEQDTAEEGNGSTDESTEEFDSSSKTKSRKQRAVTPLIAIHLRLSEIEFADMSVSAERGKVRQMLTQLANLGREYRKRHREKTIAEAEAAWRTSWFND